MPPSQLSPSVRVPIEESSQAVPHAVDLALAQCVLSGDADAWECFVQRYAGLMYAVIRRQLRTTDIDDIRSVLVNVLVAVRTSKLRAYAGRAALSTWLTIVTRSEALDFLRRRHGRPRYRRLIARLGETDRLILRLYHFEGCTPHQVAAALRDRGEECAVEDVVARVRALEDRLGGAWMEDVAYELHARSVRFVSARLLAYLDHVRDESRHRAETESPEYHLMEREARGAAHRLAELMGRLGQAERELIRLRYEDGRTAEQTARDLGLPGPRAVYTMTDRILRKIRRWLEGVGTDRR